MNILHITCSPRRLSSESFALSEAIVRYIVASEPSSRIVTRALGSRSLPHVDEGYAHALAGRLPADTRSSATTSLASSDELISEVERADVIVIGTPVHNFTVPSVLKAWIDHVVRVERTFGYSAEGKVGLLRDRPVFVAVAAGGVHFGEQASQPDFLTPYVKAILGTIGLKNITFFRMQGLARGQQAVDVARREAHRVLREYFSISAN